MNGVVQDVIVQKNKSERLGELAKLYVERANTKLPGLLDEEDLQVKTGESYYPTCLSVELPEVFGTSEFKDITKRILELAEAGSYVFEIDGDVDEYTAGKIKVAGYVVTPGGVHKIKVTAIYNQD